MRHKDSRYYALRRKYGMRRCFTVSAPELLIKAFDEKIRSKYICPNDFFVRAMLIEIGEPDTEKLMKGES